MYCKETSEVPIFTADVPGLKRGAGRSTTAEKFLDSFRLPNKSKADQVEAFMEDGGSPSPCPRRRSRSQR
jgi:hypothetical protein